VEVLSTMLSVELPASRLLTRRISITLSLVSGSSSEKSALKPSWLAASAAGISVNTAIATNSHGRVACSVAKYASAAGRRRSDSSAEGGFSADI
jgi:hypothetical protein